MGAIVSVALGISGWVRGIARQNPRAPLLAGLIWVWMWILTWASTDNPDLNAYLYLYSSAQTTEGIGPGYWLLVRIARGAGLDYTAFLAVSAGLAFLILALVAATFTKRTTLVAVLYFIYPFAYDAIQSRNLIAMSLVVLGFAMRSRARHRGNAIFIGIVVAAASLHITMLVFLVCVPLGGKRGRPYAQVAMVVGVLATPVVALFPRVIGSLSDFILRQLDTSTSRYESYFSTQGSFGILMYTGLHLLSLFVLRESLPTIRDGDRDSRTTLAGLTLRTGMVFTLLLPFVAINSNFFRLMRNLWFLYAISFSIGLDRRESVAEPGRLPWLVGGLTLLHFTAFTLSSFDTVLAPLLEHNRLVNQVTGLM